MKVHAIALAAALAAAAPASHAWFFFIIPGVGPFSNNKPLDNEICVTEGTKVGDVTQSPKGMIKIESITGPVALCHNVKGYPILAKFVPAPASAAAPAPSPNTSVHCVASSFALGAPYHDQKDGIGEIVGLAKDSPACSGGSDRNLATVSYPSPRKFAADPAPARAQAVAAPAGKTVQDRLRELKQLRDDNLITQENYEAKQRDILSAQ